MWTGDETSLASWSIFSVTSHHCMTQHNTGNSIEFTLQPSNRSKSAYLTMKSLFRRKKKADLDFFYFSIGEGLDVDSQLADATAAPPAQFSNAKYGFSAKGKSMSRGKFTVQANEGKATPHTNATNEDKVEPPASRDRTFSRKEGPGNAPFIPSFLDFGGPPLRTDSPCNEVDANDGFFTSFSPNEGRGGILIPHLNDCGENNSNIDSSSISQRHLPLIVKKDKHDRGGLLSNPVHTHMNEVEVNGMEGPTTIATPLRTKNLGQSRNWSDEPPAPNRWHQVRDADEDTEEDGDEIREDFDDAFEPDLLVDDLCNQSKPVGCVSIAVTTGIAALWLL